MKSPPFLDKKYNLISSFTATHDTFNYSQNAFNKYHICTFN